MIQTHPISRFSRRSLLALGMAVLCGQAMAASWTGMAKAVAKEIQDQSVTVQHNGPVEIGFSPGQGSEKLILRVIESAKSEIRVLAYSYTSVPVTQALIAARHRGVDVAMIVDEKSNVREDKSHKSVHALNALVNAGARVRTIGKFPIHHDKTICVDRETTQTGSFNYSANANRNSENVVVFWRAPEVTQVYLAHWQERFDAGTDYQPGY